MPLSNSCQPKNFHNFPRTCVPSTLTRSSITLSFHSMNLKKLSLSGACALMWWRNYSRLFLLCVWMHVINVNVRFNRWDTTKFEATWTNTYTCLVNILNVSCTVYGFYDSLLFGNHSIIPIIFVWVHLCPTPRTWIKWRNCFVIFLLFSFLMCKYNRENSTNFGTNFKRISSVF